MSEPAIRQFAQLISTMAIENVPVAATEQIRWRVLNAFAILLSTQRNREPRAAAPSVADAKPGLSSSPALSALLYGATLDCERPDAGVTPVALTVDAAIIPAAWALVQACQGSGHLFMGALAAGYSATAVLAALPAIDQSSAWQAAVMSGAVGAAAAAASANQLPAGATLDAMGFATAQAAQLADNAAMLAQADTYPVAGDVDQNPPDLSGPGRVAMDGVLSARMAALGGHCLPVMIDQLQQAMGTVDLNRVLADAWTAFERNGPCTRETALSRFRQRVAPVMGDGQTDTVIRLVLRLEHTTPGELAACLHG